MYFISAIAYTELTGTLIYYLTRFENVMVNLKTSRLPLRLYLHRVSKQVICRLTEYNLS